MKLQISLKDGSLYIKFNKKERSFLDKKLQNFGCELYTTYKLEGQNKEAEVWRYPEKLGQALKEHISSKVSFLTLSAKFDDDINKPFLFYTADGDIIVNLAFLRVRSETLKINLNRLISYDEFLLTIKIISEVLKALFSTIDDGVESQITFKKVKIKDEVNVPSNV